VNVPEIQQSAAYDPEKLQNPQWKGLRSFKSIIRRILKQEIINPARISRKIEKLARGVALWKIRIL
jgi:hypothetical protein